MKKLFAIIVFLLLNINNANANFYVDGFGYGSKYRDGLIKTIVNNFEYEKHTGGGGGVSIGVAKNINDAIYVGLEVFSLYLGKPIMLDVMNFKLGVSVADVTGYGIIGLSFGGFTTGFGFEYRLPVQIDKKSTASIFGEYKRYNQLLDDGAQVIKIGVRVYMK